MLKHLDGLNEEKRKIIACKDNILVTANPGTGKTKLLAHKYIDLVANGASPEKIICLTFTKKAKKELENRIMDLIEKSGTQFDLSKLNVATSHSFALDHLDQDDIISTNLLRYSIYKYLKENEVLIYGDEYLINTIVPKMENLLRYLKSFGIMPSNIDVKKVKALLTGNDKYEKEELDKFAEYFLEIFKHYEKAKEGRGMDYADLLIEFLKLKNPPIFDYVLVDELQDVNKMEADIALKYANKFVAVGDKKQAIFGFQGGSIINFKKFVAEFPKLWRSKNAIAFPKIYLWLSWQKLDKKAARKVVWLWAELKLCSIKKFCGVKSKDFWPN